MPSAIHELAYDVSPDREPHVRTLVTRPLFRPRTCIVIRVCLGHRGSACRERKPLARTLMLIAMCRSACMMATTEKSTRAKMNLFRSHAFERREQPDETVHCSTWRKTISLDETSEGIGIWSLDAMKSVVDASTPTMLLMSTVMLEGLLR